MRAALAVAALLAGGALLVAPAPARRIRMLPAGTVEIAEEIAVDSETELRGAPSGTLLRASPRFAGRALVVCSGRNIRLSGFDIDGNRAVLERRSGLPPYDRPFARFTALNGVLAEAVRGITIERLRIRETAGFAILVSASSDVAIANVEVENSGGHNERGRNNTTGGILLEGGTARFSVANCTLRNVRGNGIWTHSLYTAPRNGPGTISNNAFHRIGRDALQAGHAVDVRIENNRGSGIGFPLEDVDREGGGIPCALDTAGNVERTVYAGNRFEEINGKCIDLDGFHDGEVRGNVCVNREPPERYPSGNYGIVMNNTNPDMRSRNIRIVENEIRGPLFGGVFVIGEGHLVARNRLLDLNRSECNENAARFGCYYAPGEPDMLRTGIYFGRGAERPDPARGNVVEDNLITGFRMAERCIGYAPGIPPGANTVRRNRCADTRLTRP